MDCLNDKLVYCPGDDDKVIVYAQGIIKHFDIDGDTPSLYFDGELLDGSEKIKRNIKLSKRIIGYKAGNNSPISRTEFPKKNDIYEARIMIETWDWNGHNCKRVLAFELHKYLGLNENYSEDGEIINPFSLI